MNLHKKLLYVLTFLTLYFRLATPLKNNHLLVAESGIEDISPCSVGLKFFSVLNNTSNEDYFVELISDECCVHADETLDCGSVEIIGESSEVVEKGKVKTFALVAPVLDPFERKGYCVIHVDSRPVGKRNKIMRNTIQIDFDTRLDKEQANSKDSIRKCMNIDEDPLNNCEPVNCDTHYNGKKPIYDKNTKRCIEIPKCNDMDSISRVYDPLANRCIDGDPVENEDIDFIKSLTKERHPKDVVIFESNGTDSNATAVKESSYLNDSISDNIVNNVKPNIYETKPSYCIPTYIPIIKYLMANKYTLIVLGTIVLVQCCLICTMIYCLTKKSICCDNKMVERKYFNYRQDVSVTTPLIGTSNIDTETTGFDYISESSNIDKKIKCYKACQKERKNDPKISMSDDILLKCLNRRDWNLKPRSDSNDAVNDFYNNIRNVEWNKNSVVENTIPEYPPSEKGDKKEEDEDKKRTREEARDSHHKEDHYRRDEDCRQQNDYSKAEIKHTIKEDYTDSDSSEKLIQCHDYNMIQSRKNLCDKLEHNKVTTSISTEKGAQACFSNDSIDEFISEITGENFLKHPFASNSSLISSTELSNKTSKNNIVKNVLSYLSRKSKICTSSDPGVKKVKSKAKDLELIHMSRASVYSSSASEYIKGVKFTKDSRSSF